MTSFAVLAGQANVMMMLGGFKFFIHTAAYRELNRRTEYKWPSQHRFGKRPSYQWVGEGDDTMQLSGVIYPEFRGGFHQIETLRSIASRGQPQLLIDGLGKILGRWVIEGIDEKQSTFAGFGAPRKQEFTLQLRKFS